LVQGVLRSVSAFERRTTRTEAVAWLMLKLFIAQLINTAFLVIIINANLTYFYGSDYARPPFIIGKGWTVRPRASSTLDKRTSETTSWANSTVA
jgi:hypothetical protein